MFGFKELWGHGANIPIKMPPGRILDKDHTQSPWWIFDQQARLDYFFRRQWIIVNRWRIPQMRRLEQQRRDELRDEIPPKWFEDLVNLKFNSDVWIDIYVFLVVGAIVLICGYFLFKFYINKDSEATVIEKPTIPATDNQYIVIDAVSSIYRFIHGTLRFIWSLFVQLFS